MRRISTVALVALVALSLTSAAHAAKAKTSLEIFGTAYGDNKTYYEGEVSSPKGSCEEKRKVSVYRKSSGDDILMVSGKSGSTPSMNGGRIWAFSHNNYALNGTFYAKSKATRKCKSGRSDDFEFNECMPVRRGVCRAAPNATRP
jgi:hypothetical protein